MNNRKRTILSILSILALLGLLTVFVLADSDYPYGVRSITEISSSRADPTTFLPANISNVMAGNVTEITLDAISTTKAWAGYYGNITGTITLQTSDGYVFYNWTSLEPKGEIYASLNNTVTWANIVCFNWDVVGGQTFTEQDVEDWYGIGDDASDGISETFNYTLTTNFYVGTRDITAESTAAGATCHSTNPYINGEQRVATRFENTLLTDNDRLVYAAMIENRDLNNQTDYMGFDGREHDFQLLVAENGHDGQEDTPTTYFFWAEIE